jgi:hypothetical protein
VQNAGVEPILGLTLTAGASRASVPRIEPGGVARLYLGGRGVHTLRMRFNQKGNALGAYEQPGFDAALLNRDSFKLVLRVRTNEVERYQDDGDPATPAGKLLQAFWKSVEDAVDPESEFSSQ